MLLARSYLLNSGVKLEMMVKIITCVVLHFCFLPIVSRSDNYTSDSLDAFIQDSALRALDRSRPLTGALYKAPLPGNVSGMAVSVVRLRSRRLWNIGANFSYFRIPPRTETVPHVKRLAIVYQDLGNWSSHYYNVPGYSMITSVVGFTVFNASDAKTRSLEKVSLNTKGNGIAIHFSDSRFIKNMTSGARCAAFDTKGAFRLSGISEDNLCYSRDQGHFSVVLPLGRERDGRRTRRLWYLWIIGSVLLLGGLGLVGYFWVLSRRFLRRKKIQVMERQSGKDLVLENKWIGNSKMPSATVTRTQPTLEDGT